MYSNKILNFQESTIILKAYTKQVWKLIEGTTYIRIRENTIHTMKEEKNKKKNSVEE